MSEAWHQHLAHLSWWEEIDRFFNPAKYSCTTTYGCGFQLQLILPEVIAGALIISLAFGVYIWWKSRNDDSPVTTEKTSDGKV